MPVITMREVAKAAGVSVATVSRVLSGTRRVDQELVDRVRVAQAELGYRTNLVASGLRRQRTDTIGMVVPQVANPYFSALMQAVGRRLRVEGKSVLLVDAEDDPREEAEGLRRLVDRSVDGLVAIPVDEHASAAALSEAAGVVRTVLLDRAAIDVPADLVAVDHELGIGAVVDHLAGLGRCHLAFVGASFHDSTARERQAAFEVAVRTAACGTHRTLLGDYSVEWGRAAASQLLDEPLPDAVVCGNDLIALGVLATFHEAGVEVPGHVAVTGYDDVGFATLTSPTLTTVRQPLDALADAAVTRLLDDPPHGARISSTRLEPSLVVRRSSTLDPPEVSP